MVKTEGYTKTTDRCPICGQGNRCAIQSGKTLESCWCRNVSFPEEIFDRIPPEQRNKVCICNNCVDRYQALKTERELHTTGYAFIELSQLAND